jgi:hypothetical protein
MPRKSGDAPRDKPSPRLERYLTNYSADSIDAVLKSKDIHPTDKALIAICGIVIPTCGAMSFKDPPMCVYAVIAGLAVFFALLVFRRTKNDRSEEGRENPP